METSKLRRRMPVSALTDPKILIPAIGSAFAKLDPRVMVKSPVMFVVEIGSVVTSYDLIRDHLLHRPGFGFELQITLWLWFTVLFANFAEAMAACKSAMVVSSSSKADGRGCGAGGAAMARAPARAGNAAAVTPVSAVVCRKRRRAGE